MKFSNSCRFIFIFVLAVVVTIAGCSKAPLDADLKIGNWGPQSAEIGSIPNQQPDGGMGVWIEVSGKQNLGDFQVMFDGRPMDVVGGNEQAITTSVPPALLGKVGSKEIAIKRSKDGKLFVVGSFLIIGKEPAAEVSKKFGKKH